MRGRPGRSLEPAPSLNRKAEFKTDERPLLHRRTPTAMDRYFLLLIGLGGTVLVLALLFLALR